MKVTYGAIVQRASGRFGGTVHSNWKGIDVVRRFAKPSNPNTTAQLQTRYAFSGLTRMFTLTPTEVRAAWTSFATGKQFTNRNKFLGLNIPAIAGDVDVTNMLPTPGDASTIPPTAFVPTGGIGQITTVITEPSIPTGWAITGCIACAVSNNWDPSANGDPNPETVIFYEAIDLATPFAPTITCPADVYLTWAFIKWLAPDGSTRYSAPLAGAGVVVT